MALVRIEDADDPRIAEFRSIRERDLTGTEGRFIAEGTVVLRMLAAAHRAGGDFVAEKLLLLENRVSGLTEIFPKFPEDVPVHVASGAVLDEIAGFHLHRGVLAVGRRRQERAAAELIAGLPAKALVGGCLRHFQPRQYRFDLRNAAAFGADAVLLDQSCCDPLYRKALRVSVGSVSVPYVRNGSTAEILSGLTEAGCSIWGLSPAGEVEIRNAPASDRMVLITAHGRRGLPADILAHNQDRAHCPGPRPRQPQCRTATGIALYEIAMAQGRL